MVFSLSIVKRLLPRFEMLPITNNPPTKKNAGMWKL